MFHLLLLGYVYCSVLTCVCQLFIKEFHDDDDDEVHTDIVLVCVLQADVFSYDIILCELIAQTLHWVCVLQADVFSYGIILCELIAQTLHWFVFCRLMCFHMA